MHIRQWTVDDIRGMCWSWMFQFLVKDCFTFKGKDYLLSKWEERFQLQGPSFHATNLVFLFEYNCKTDLIPLKRSDRMKLALCVVGRFIESFLPRKIDICSMTWMYNLMIHLTGIMSSCLGGFQDWCDKHWWHLKLKFCQARINCYLITGSDTVHLSVLLTCGLARLYVFDSPVLLKPLFCEDFPRVWRLIIRWVDWYDNGILWSLIDA